jgi:hypothetical protein
MSIGYNTILRLERVRAECGRMGFDITSPGPYNDSIDMLALMPAKDALPIYSRDAELFVGTLDDLEQWLRGANWMHQYYALHKLVDEKKIKKKEDDIRHDQLVRKLRNEEIITKG